jgi:hypothetical protein
MNNSTNQTFTDSYRCMMTAVFVGFADSLISLIYNILYRLGGADFPNDLINVAYIIFGEMALFFVIGVIYTGLHRVTKKADGIFIIGFAALTILIFIAVGSGQFAASTEENLRFRGILHGLTLIMGISATAGIPYFYHSKAFERYVV